MAEKSVESVQPEIGRELCLVKAESRGYRGYKRDILSENLSEREYTMFVCIRCQGIMREVCLSSNGVEQFCSCCKKEGERANPNLQIDSMILSFKCSCPLVTRGCKWLGALGGCQYHLDTCGYVLEACRLRCGEVLQRDELKVHEREKCPQRIVKCKHCRTKFKSCELATHLEKCPKMEVSCELKCGMKLCREDVTQHVEQDCVEKEIECPFAKYKCVGLIKRKNLRNHLEENQVEHLELKMDMMQECMLEESAKQKEKISEMNTTIQTMSRKIKSLEEEMETLALLPKAIKLNLEITKIPESGFISVYKRFQVAGYNLLFYFYNSSNILEIRVSPQTGSNYDELKWPFKAEFVIHLSSQSNPGNIKKFKSEVLEWKRENFYSDSFALFKFPFIISTLTRDEFMEHFNNGEAQFEIFIIILNKVS